MKVSLSATYRIVSVRAAVLAFENYGTALYAELQQALRDLTRPGELEKVFAQVVQARQEGLASLERARGETAALRNLANAADSAPLSLRSAPADPGATPAE